MNGRLIALAAVGAAESVLIRLGRAYGSTRAERATALAGDEIVPAPSVVTDHAMTIAAPPESIWPWLVQMGWHRAGWYTARWVDRLLFPANWPSATAVLPDLQQLRVGDFIPDGPPESECGLIVERLEPPHVLVLHSTSHLPLSWRRHAAIDWSWTFVLAGLDGGRRTRFHFRSRWTTRPWWLTALGWLVVVPADFVMARDMLRGIRRRVEHRPDVPAGRESATPAAVATTAGAGGAR